MASTTANPLSFSLLPENYRLRKRVQPRRRLGHNRVLVRVSAVQNAGNRRRAPPGVDTRIHWENEDEGWIGGSDSQPTQRLDAEVHQKDLLGEKFADLLNNSFDSHYQ